MNLVVCGVMFLASLANAHHDIIAIGGASKREALSLGGQQSHLTTTVKSAMEHILEEELTQYLGLARYEHVPWGRRPELTRSGTYTRDS